MSGSLPRCGCWQGRGPGKGQEPRPHASLSVNRLTNLAYPGKPVTSNDSITTSELKAKLFKRQEQGALCLPPAASKSGAEQWVAAAARRNLSGTALAVTESAARPRRGTRGDGVKRTAACNLTASEGRRPATRAAATLSSYSVGASRDSSPPSLLSDHRPHCLPQHVGPRSKSVQREHPHHILGISNAPTLCHLSV